MFIQMLQSTTWQTIMAVEKGLKAVLDGNADVQEILHVVNAVFTNDVNSGTYPSGYCDELRSLYAHLSRNNPIIVSSDSGKWCNQ
jgi:hypothetical protein